MNGERVETRSDLLGPRGVVFLAGAGGMALEVLAARMAHPTFGSSVYVWGALLTVFLSGLAIGYRAGGGRARRGAGMPTVTAVLIGAAIYTGAVLLAAEPVMEMLASPPLPFTLQSLPALALLFGPPSILVGYVSPITAEAVEDGAGAGHAAGTVYGWGTAGSIAGAAGAAFLLLPYLGLELSLISVTALFLIGAVLAASTVPSLRARLPALLLPATLLLVIGAFAATTGGPATDLATDGPVLHQEDSLYHSIEVVERGGVRTLKLNDDRHSAEYVDGRSGYVFTYGAMMHLPLLYRDPSNVDRVLAIGGGAGSVPTRYAEFYSAEVDVVELDPAVVRVADEYFDADRPGINWITMDGRRYLRTTDKKYDVVLLDAYRAGGIPEHLATQEFMEDVQKHLEPGGIVASNLIGSPNGEASRLWKAEHHTMETTFGEADAYLSHPTSPLLQNIIIVAHTGPEPTDEELQTHAEKRPIGIDLTPYIDGRIPEPDTADLPVLRDDGGAVDHFSHAVAGSELPSLATGSKGER